MIENYKSSKKDSIFQIRLTAKQRMILERNTQNAWFKHMSEFVKDRCLTKA